MMDTATTPGAAFTKDGPGWRYRVESLPIRRLQNFTIGALVVAVGAVVEAVNSAHAPAAEGREVDLVTRAWLVRHGTVDRPPLGAVMLAGWDSATGAFDRATTAVGAGRELMVVAYVVSAGLLWVLGRRLGLDRWSAALAVAVFGLIPPAVDLHRQVALDNLAVPWVLAAAALAATPRRALAAYAAAGACLAVAVLTRDTAALFLPVLAVLVRRTSVPSTRRYVTAITGTLFVLVGGAVLLTGAGRPLDAGRAPGLAILALPVAALLLAGLVQLAWHRREDSERSTTPLLAVAVVAATTVGAWWVAEHDLVAPTGTTEPTAQAAAWLRANAGDTRVVADDTTWVDLAVADVRADHLTAIPPRGALVVVAGHHQALPAAAPRLATFGRGRHEIDVLQPGAEPLDASEVAAQGAALARNPSVQLSAPARRALVNGQVDPRVMLVLVGLGTSRPVAVTGFPVDAAEARAGALRRVVELRLPDDAATRAAITLLHSQHPPFRPTHIRAEAGGRLVITYTAVDR